MAASKTLKSSDRQNIIKKLTIELKKRYKGNPPKTVRSVIETLIFASCLEDSNFEDAEQAFQQLLDAFFDLNEIRVSSVDEIKRALGSLNAADWKAFRIREALQDIFEKHFSFDLDGLKRKTLEIAHKELAAIPHQSLFAQAYTLQSCLGAHIVPIDETMFAALVWFGLTEPDTTPQQAADELKIATKKSEAQQICYLFKALAVDPELAPAFSDLPYEEIDPHEAHKRLASLIKHGPPKPSKRPAAAASKQAAAASKPSATAEKPVATASKPAASTGSKGAANTKAPASNSTPEAAKKPAAKGAVTKPAKVVEKTPDKKILKKKPQPKPAAAKSNIAKPAAKNSKPTPKDVKKVTKKKPVKKPTSRKSH